MQSHLFLLSHSLYKLTSSSQQLHQSSLFSLLFSLHSYFLTFFTAQPWMLKLPPETPPDSMMMEESKEPVRICLLLLLLSLFFFIIFIILFIQSVALNASSCSSWMDAIWNRCSYNTTKTSIKNRVFHVWIDLRPRFYH